MQISNQNLKGFWSLKRGDCHKYLLSDSILKIKKSNNNASIVQKSFYIRREECHTIIHEPKHQKCP